MSFNQASPSGPPAFLDAQLAEQRFNQNAQQQQQQAQQAFQQQQQQAYQQQQQFQFNQPLPAAPGSQPHTGAFPPSNPYAALYPPHGAPPASGMPYGYPDPSAAAPSHSRPAPVPPSTSGPSPSPSPFPSQPSNCPSHSLYAPGCQACNPPSFQDPSSSSRNGGNSLTTSQNLPMSPPSDDIWDSPSASDPSSRSHNPGFGVQIVDPTITALPTTFPAYPKNPPSSSSSSLSAPRKAADICICPNCNKPKKPSFDFCSKDCGNRTCNHRSSGSSLPAPSGTGDVARKLALLEKATPPTVTFFRQFSGSKIPKKIEFYEKSAAFYEFTNFHEDYPIIICSSQWRTSEHFFQASKFAAYPEKMDEVRRLPTPRDAFNYVRERSNLPFIRSDWQSVKDGVMLMALRAKFSQNEKLAAILLATEHAELIEHTVNDNYWADGGDGKGENKLGQLLMQVREELRPSVVPPPS